MVKNTSNSKMYFTTSIGSLERTFKSMKISNTNIGLFWNFSAAGVSIDMRNHLSAWQHQQLHQHRQWQASLSLSPSSTCQSSPPIVKNLNKQTAAAEIISMVGNFTTFNWWKTVLLEMASILIVPFEVFTS